MNGNPIPCFEARLKDVWRRSDEILALIPDDAWHERPIGLRHPFLFYMGHLPAFAWNQVCRGALGAGHLVERLDLVYARGIDPDDTDIAVQQSIKAWPSLEETIAYRDEVRRVVLSRIGDVLSRTDDELCENGRVLEIVIEHEVMHHETLLYMVAEAPPGMICRPVSIAAPEGGLGGVAELRRIPAGKAVIGAAWDAIPFGWDNEFGRLEMDVAAFTIDSLSVTNREWASFLEKQGKRAELVPCSWVGGAGGFSVKTVFGPVPFEVAEGWPVQVSGEQARIYCEVSGGRLPTEAELCRAAYGAPDGATRRYPWGDAAPSAEHGNFGFRRWYSTPVGFFPRGVSAFGVEELVGNGWEWTCSSFAPLPGFRPWARTYPGYSADFFDGAHDIVFGASWATDDVLLRPSFRNWYRRNYPYPFTSFRVVR